MITLTLKEQPDVPLEAEVLSPDVMAALAHDAIRALPVFLGKRQCRVDDFFDGRGRGQRRAENPRRCEEGQVDRPRHDPRPHHASSATPACTSGAYMKGGAIEVSGNASDWVGGEMTGGLIRVRGNAGGQVGAAYRGSRTGMKGGTILIDGTAGLEVGMRMKRGTIAIGGLVRDFAGLQMKGGTIVLLSGAEIRTGAWMIRGTIVSLKPIPLLPTLLVRCPRTIRRSCGCTRGTWERWGSPFPMKTRTGPINATRATRRFQAKERFLSGNR